MTQIFVVLLLVLGLDRVASSDDSKLSVAYANGKLSVHADGIALAEVLAEVARASGSRISGLLEESRAVTTAFADQPVDAALDRLLAGQPFATRYRGERLVAIRLIDRGKGGDPVIVYPTPARPVNVDDPPMIALSGRLASRVGAPRATLARVALTALSDADRAIRHEAAAAIVSATNGDPTIRDELVATYGRMSEETLLHLVREMPGAAAFFEHIAAHSSSDELRDKVKTILRMLRPPDDAASASGRS